MNLDSSVSPLLLLTQWTPFECFPLHTSFTPSGLIVLEPGTIVSMTSDVLVGTEVQLFQRYPITMQSNTNSETNTKTKNSTDNNDNDDSVLLLPLDDRTGYAIPPSSIPKSVKYQPSCANLTMMITSHRILLTLQQSVPSSSSNNSNNNAISKSKNAPNESSSSSTSSSSSSSNSRPIVRYIHLSHVLSCHCESKFLQAPKILLMTTLGEIYLHFVNSSSSSATSSSDNKRDRDDAYTILQKALQRQEWNTIQKLQQDEKIRKAAISRKVGVDAILAANRQKHHHAEQITTQVFGSSSSSNSSSTTTSNNINRNGSSSSSSSAKATTTARDTKNKDQNNHQQHQQQQIAVIDQFMNEAAELIQIIHRYVATLERQNEMNQVGVAGSSSSSNNDANQFVNHNDDNNNDDTMNQEDAVVAQQNIAQLLSNMGMTSALTMKEIRGGNIQHSQQMYYETLCRQVYDYIQPKVLAMGGYMTLTDVFCHYNRARATNLISPDHLLSALSLLPTLQLHMSLRTLSSGLIILQDHSVDEISSAKKLHTLASSTIVPLHLLSSQNIGGITADIAANHLHIPTVLATEQLLAAEQQGLLVRDESMEGIRYYPNLFEQYLANITK
jgi:ESCRT-II complex subunit VPS36